MEVINLFALGNLNTDKIDIALILKSRLCRCSTNSKCDGFFLKISKIMLQHLSLIKLGCDNVLHILKFEI